MADRRPDHAETPPPSDHRVQVNAAASRSDAVLIVGIGAAAGGLEACKKLLAALPNNNGMAFILVQPLDPADDSIAVDLLTGHTTMAVNLAADGMPIDPDHLYIIPPGTYPSVARGILHLSQPQARDGAQLPFDFLLHALAVDRKARAACVILSGTGADGSLGLKSVKARGGLVIAQDPNEASYGGMPRNAILTDGVDFVLPIAEIPGALQRFIDTPQAGAPQQWLLAILNLLRSQSAHDVTRYKTAMLESRTERRMAMAGIAASDGHRYLQMLEADPAELRLLAKDLRTNVTGFFRDPQVFAHLADTVIPEIVQSHAPDRPIRIWIAGCGTGEETYALAMLFREAISAAKLAIKLQVFASDIDPDAIAVARHGLYPDTIEADVSAARIARFFSRRGHRYRVSPELRATIVFTEQDVLVDPPFSRLDFVACRHLLINLRPEAQAEVVATFHFALEPGGILLLGPSETAGDTGDRFDMISDTARLYRRIGRAKPDKIGFTKPTGDRPRPPVPLELRSRSSRQSTLAELCRRMVLELYDPAAVLINRDNECLYFLGSTDRYLPVVPGHPSYDLLAMAGEDLRTKLRSAIQRAIQNNARIVIPGGQTTQDDETISFSISVQPVRSEDDDLLLICFLDDPKPAATAEHASSVMELKQELAATRTELQGAIHNLQVSGEEQQAVNEETISIQQEYQLNNDTLLTAKEQLQSLNEALTALNSRLQESLERQRTTSNDLQNMLYSTDVATLFLDEDLSIRFFTPATKTLFAIIPGDIGRPLSDLNFLALDADLLVDATSVMQTLVSVEREVEAETGACYLRRILPYRTQDNGVRGVVVTFADITERRRIVDELSVAKRQAELANAAKSRFLAAASHDLRQPLQTLALVQGLLSKNVQSEKAHKLVDRMDETIGAMAGMLNALLDINQMETGTVRADLTNFMVTDLFEQMRREFAYHAQAKGLVLRVMPCTVMIRSDPRLLEQMIRNLVSNAIKFTRRGKVLLGCRRHKETVLIEVCDTGIGIADQEFEAIFEEYHQVNNAARERSRGLGLGLSIVKRLGTLLGHRIQVRSSHGKGSVFSIEIARSDRIASIARSLPPPVEQQRHSDVNLIMVIEDDPDLLELLDVFLREEGHDVATASSGTAALDLVTSRGVRPDLIIADYNLPGGLDGLRTIGLLRHKISRPIPGIVLTGDVSAATSRRITSHDCIHLSKPMKLKQMTQTIRRLLPVSNVVDMVRPPRPETPQDGAAQPVIFVVDDDDCVREALRGVLEDDGRTVEDFSTCEAFLETYRPGREACLVIDAYLPGMNGLALLERLRDIGYRLPAIMITGNSDVQMAVQAMKAGASDFIEKPVGRRELLTCVDRALERSRDSSKRSAWRENATTHVAGLTPRQREIMDMILAGHPNKNIAADLGISQRTVENHRAAIMAKTGVKSLPALARLALVATLSDAG